MTTFLRVTLPLSVPGILAASLIVFIPVIGDYVTPRLVGGPDGLMIANMIQVQFLKINDAPMGAALSVAGDARRGRHRRPLRAGPQAVAAVSLRVYVGPLPRVPLRAGRRCCRCSRSTTPPSSPSRSAASPPAGSPDLPQTPALIRSVQTSAVVAVTSAVLATLLGICAARAGARYRFRGKRAVIGFVMLPLVLPEIIVAVSLLVVLLGAGLPLGPWTVILGHVLICTPFSVAILNGAFASLDASLEEAAQDLGEGAWGTFMRVILPLVAPGIVSSLLIAFTISLDEFIIAFFLTGTEPTLPVYLWGQLRFPQKIPIVMALGTLLVAFSVLMPDGGRDHAPARRGAVGALRRGKVPVSDAGPGRPIIHLAGVAEALRHLPRAARHRPRHSRGRVLLAAGAVGLRQDHTLLRTIAGFEDASAGLVELDGRDMAGVAPNRRPTNMVFQSYAIFRT